MTSTNQEKSIKKTFYKAIRFMLVADIVQSLQEMMLDYFISQHLGSDGLAAFGIAYPLITVIMALIACPVAGVQAICARDLSKKDIEKARVHLCTGLTWCFFIMLVFSLVCWIFHYPLITALGAEGEYAHLRDASTQALLVSTLCGPFLGVLIILLTNLIFNENRKNAAFLGIFSIALQIIVTGVTSSIMPTMAGIWGGYTLSLAISDFLILLYLRISHKDPDSMFYHIRPMFQISGVKESLRTGLPEMLCWCYYILSAALRNSLVIHIGNKDALAAVTLSDGAELGELVMTALFYAVLVTIGSAYGSQDREKYRTHISTVAKSVLKIAIGGGIIFMVTAWPILNLFIEEGESQEVFYIALKILIIYAFNFIFYLLTSMFSSLYETIGLLKYAHLNYLLEVVFYAVLMVTLGFSIGVDGIWYAQPIAEILLLFFNLWLVWKSCGHFPRKFADFGFDREVFELEQG